MTSAQLMASIRKYPLPVGCGVASVVLAVATFFRSDAVPQATAELDQKSAEAQRYSSNLANSAQLKDQYDAIVAANKAISSRLIHASQLGINQQYFYKLESEYGVKLMDLHQTSRVEGKGTFAPIGFSVTAQGDFSALVGLLQAVERGTHFCRVNSATCTGVRGGPITLVLNLELLGEP